MPARISTKLHGASRTPLEESFSMRGFIGVGVEKYISLSLSQLDESQPLPLPSPLPSSLTKGKERTNELK